MVEVEYIRHLKRFLSLKELQSHRKGVLEDLPLFRRSRLSVSSVSPEAFAYILALEDEAE